MQKSLEAVLTAFSVFLIGSFESWIGRTGRVMFLLIVHVSNDPSQVFSTETNNTIACLPVKELPICDFVVDVKGAPAF